MVPAGSWGVISQPNISARYSTTVKSHFNKKSGRALGRAEKPARRRGIRSFQQIISSGWYTNL